MGGVEKKSFHCSPVEITTPEIFNSSVVQSHFYLMHLLIKLNIFLIFFAGSFACFIMLKYSVLQNKYYLRFYRLFKGKCNEIYVWDIPSQIACGFIRDKVSSTLSPKLKSGFAMRLMYLATHKRQNDRVF